MSRAPNGPVPVDASGVEILSPATKADLAREVERDGQLVDALERRVGFTDESWRTWHSVTLAYCATHYLEARDTRATALHEATDCNLRRVLRLDAKGDA